MKYLLVVFSLLLSAAVMAQCPYYQDYINKGDVEMMKGSETDFELVINAYNTALLHCPDSTDVVGAKILAAFTAIERLKLDAEAAKLQAEKAEGEAVIARERADSLTLEEIAARKETEQLLAEVEEARDSIVALNAQRVLQKETEHLQELGQQQLTSGNYEAANQSYTELLRLLKTPEADALNQRKIEAAEERLLEIDSLARLEKSFDQHIATGDSMANKEDYEKAFFYYTKALDTKYDDERSKGYLAQLEEQLGYKLKRNKNIAAGQYFQLLALSANNNDILNNNERFDRRMREALALYPVDTVFEAFPRVQEYAQTYRKKTLHRMMLSGGIKMYSPRLSPDQVMAVRVNHADNVVEYPLLYMLASVGISYRISEKYGIEISYHTNEILPGPANSQFDNFPAISSIEDFDGVSGTSFRYPVPMLNEIEINGTVELLQRVNKKWQTKQLSLQATGGFVFGRGSLGLANDYVELAFDHTAAPADYFTNLVNSTAQQLRINVGDQENISTVVDPGYGNANGMTSDQSYLNFLSCKNILIQLPFTNAFSTFNYINGNLGLRARYTPFQKHRVQLIGKITYNFAIQRLASPISFNLGEEMYAAIEQQEVISGPDLNALQSYYQENCNIDLSIDTAFRQFNSGLSFVFGLGFRL